MARYVLQYDVIKPPCPDEYCHCFRLIRLTSPNLSYLIGVGTVLLYLDVCLVVMPGKDKDTVTVLCNVSHSVCMNIMISYINIMLQSLCMDVAYEQAVRATGAHL